MVCHIRSRVNPAPDFESSVVLIKLGQSQQDYRFCGNFVQHSYRVLLPPHPMPECMVILDETLDWLLISVIDIKGAFNNIPIAWDS